MKVPKELTLLLFLPHHVPMICNLIIPNFHKFVALNKIKKLLGVGLAQGKEYVSLYCSLNSDKE